MALPNYVQWVNCPAHSPRIFEIHSFIDPTIFRTSDGGLTLNNIPFRSGFKAVLFRLHGLYNSRETRYGPGPRKNRRIGADQSASDVFFHVPARWLGCGFCAPKRAENAKTGGQSARQVVSVIMSYSGGTRSMDAPIRVRGHFDSFRQGNVDGRFNSLFHRVNCISIGRRNGKNLW